MKWVKAVLWVFYLSRIHLAETCSIYLLMALEGKAKMVWPLLSRQRQREKEAVFGVGVGSSGGNQLYRLEGCLLNLKTGKWFYDCLPGS